MSDPNSSAWHRRERSRDLTGLGWLEADVLRVVWDRGEVTVRDVSGERMLRLVKLIERGIDHDRVEVERLD